MSENFNKLKKLFTRYTVIKCAVCGISLGLFVTGVVLLTLKLCAVEISPAYYVLMGVAVAALSGGLLYMLLRPTEKKFAKRLDTEFGLNEKVQTMLAYGGSDNEVVAIQRETTEARLGSVKIKLRAAEILKQLIAPVLACAMIAAAIAIPAANSRIGTGEPVYEATEDQFASLRQLINDVKSSYMETNLKASVASVLEGLLDTIDRGEDEEKMTDSQMKAAVISTVAVIDGLIAEANSYIDMGTRLKKSENLEKVGGAILSSVISYKADNTRIRTLNRVNEKSDKAEEVIPSVLRENIVAVSDLFKELYGDTLKSELVSFCGIFEELLSNTGYAGKEDGLYNVLVTLCLDLKNVSTCVGNGYTPAALQNLITEACERFTENASVELGVQAYNCMMDEFIRENLSTIFKISLAEFPSNANVVYVDESASDPGNISKPDDDKQHSGGIGDNEELFGSNDIIYYPAEDKYTQYGPVLTEYHKAVLDHLENNNVPDEYRQFITNYFDILYGGIKE